MYRLCGGCDIYWLDIVQRAISETALLSCMTAAWVTNKGVMGQTTSPQEDVRTPRGRASVPVGTQRM